jgi:energy-coupling factor transport system permease protein
VSVAVGPTSPVDRGRSWLHRLDPLVKLAWLVAVVVVALATSHPLPLFAIALVGFIVGLTAGVAGQIARVLAIFVPISASIIVIQTIAPAACQVACAPAVQLGPVDLYGDGMLRGLSLVGRLVAVETVALAVILTTHPSDLFAALARLRVPYVANLMLSMTLQLIPILQREFATVLSAQRSRALRGTGFAAVLPSFVPVFAGAFERVQQLTIGLESRAFGSSARRTSYRRIRTGPRTMVAAAAGLLAGLVGTIAGLTLWSADRTADVALPAGLVVAVFVVAGTLFVGVVLAGIRSIARA